MATHGRHDVEIREEDKLLTAGEVARLFRVSPKTVSRWAILGRLNGIETPGGRWRFFESEVRALMAGRGGNS